MPFTHRNIKTEQSGLGYQRIPPGHRFPYGHTHHRQEEVDVVAAATGGRAGGPAVFAATNPDDAFHE